jgi:hypothetical protein
MCGSNRFNYAADLIDSNVLVLRFTGLGDRHLENYLVKESDGELVCIGESV